MKSMLNAIFDTFLCKKSYEVRQKLEKRPTKPTTNNNIKTFKLGATCTPRMITLIKIINIYVNEISNIPYWFELQVFYESPNPNPNP